jgi:chromosome segregation ATPase
MLRLLAVAVSLLPNLIVAQVAALDNEADADSRVLRGVWAQIAALEPDNEALDAGSDGEDSDHEQTAESGAEEPPQAEEAEEEPPRALQQLDATDEAAADSSPSFEEEGAADADTEGPDAPDASTQLLLADVDVDSDSDSDTGAETPDTEMGKLLPEMGHRHRLESERNRDMLGERPEFSQHRRTTHNYELERKLRGEHARAAGLWREVKQLKSNLRSATSKVSDLQHQLQDSRTPRSSELKRGLRRELKKEKRLKKTLASMQHQWRHQLDIEHLKLADAEKHSDTLLTSIRNLKNETQFMHAVIQEKDATRLAEERHVAEWRAKLNNATLSSAQHSSDEHHRDVAELARARAERDKAEADLKEVHAEYGAEKAQVEQMRGTVRNLLQAQDNFAAERRTLSKEVNESRKEVFTERSKAAAMHLKVVEEGSELTVAQAQIRDVNNTLVKLTELDTNTSQKLIKTRAKLAVLSGELKAAEAEVGQLREERARLVKAQKAVKAHQDTAVRSMNDRVNQYAGILNSAQSALEAKAAALNATRKELTQMAKQASMTRADLDQRDRQLNASYKALSDKVHEISSLRAEAAQKDRTLGATRALVGEKENQLTALRGKLGKVDAD